MAGALELFSIKDNAKAVDLSYLKNYGPNYKLPTLFQKYQFHQGQSINMRICGIYDPSKFYIITKFNESDAFQAYIFKFYYEHGELYKIPAEKIRIGLYCVACIDGSYYRGLITSYPVPMKMEHLHHVKIFLVDFGGTDYVNMASLHYMTEKLYNVPQFAMRASLFGICPFGTHTWTERQMLRFQDLVFDKINLGTVIAIDELSKKLDIVVYEHRIGNEEDSVLVPVHDVLVNEGLANYVKEKQIVPDDNTEVVPKVKYLHLFPSHEVLESGAVPHSLGQMEALFEFITPDLIYKPYYEKKKSNGNAV